MAKSTHSKRKYNPFLQLTDKSESIVIPKSIMEIEAVPKVELSLTKPARLSQQRMFDVFRLGAV